MTEVNHLRLLSNIVDQILDHVGAAEQIRWNTVEKGLMDEVIMNAAGRIQQQQDVGFHVFGSACEGTMTLGLQSDIDKLHYNCEMPAVEHIPDGFQDGLLIINDGTTKPSYVKLQCVINGICLNSSNSIPILNNDFDQTGRICRTRFNLGQFWAGALFNQNVESTGPAETVLGTETVRDMDIVASHRCATVPSFASEWMRRPRKYRWPTEQQLDKMSKLGCFLVGKGHPSSPTERLEWRISFSFQERELMFSLNSTQHKCYILMKMIKQDLISKLNVKSISSYHLKTALFYTIENNPTHIWIPANLIYCTELCLKLLVDWLDGENSPNFFVPEENMFDRLSSDAMKATARLIRHILDSEGQYLMSLNCDKFGKLLQDCLLGKELSPLSSGAVRFDLSNNQMYLSRAALNKKNRLVISASRNCQTASLSALLSLIEQFRVEEEKLVSGKVFREIKKALHLLLPNIHLQISQGLAAIKLITKCKCGKKELMNRFNQHIDQARDSDVLSQRLIKASLMFTENELDECVRILIDCEMSLKDYILTACPCTRDPEYDFTKLIENGYSTSMSPLGFRRTYVTSCLIFFPSHSELAPKQLHYEMYRTFGASTETIHPVYHYWFEVIAVDAKLYLFFLQYLVYSKRNKHELATKARENLIRVLETDVYLGHRETGYNLLGWIYKQEKKFEQAMRCFVKSWRIRPDHNAAKWHMLVMIFENQKRRE